MTQRINSISAMVITYNEEENIERCLESIKWVDEIIVIDSYSKDNTVDIVKKYTNKIYINKFDNDFSKQRNFALKYMGSKWILVLDADETLSSNSKSLLKDLLSTKVIDGYWFSRRNYIDKKNYLKFGYFYPDYQLRLFKNKKGLKYFGAIHEQPNVSGRRTKKINSVEIYHNYYHTKYDSFFSFPRLFKYIRIESIPIFKSDKSTIRLLLDSLIGIIRHFYRSFFKFEGYKDGYLGFRAALIHAIYIVAISFNAFIIRLITRK